MASSTLGEALERLVRYFRILSDKEELSLEESLEGVELIVSSPDPEQPTTDESSDALMAMIVRLCRLIHGTDINPLRVTLRRQAPACSKAFSQVFRVPVEFSARRDMLMFDREALGKPLPTANTELARANDQIVIDYLAKFDRDRITMRVRSMLLDQFAAGPATQETVARELNLSARSLQRKLHEEGTTYKQLVDDTRRELAAQYVKQSQLSINEITYMLGFSEPSNFTRAFKRWTGESPSEYRLAV
jgi:AraC-like DNA-binding protein